MEPSYWTMHFDGAFAARSAGAGAVLTSPTGDKLYYAVQLCFKDNDKVYHGTTPLRRPLPPVRRHTGGRHGRA